MEETDQLARETGVRPFAQSTVERLLGRGRVWVVGRGGWSVGVAIFVRGVVLCCRFVTIKPKDW